MQQSQVQLHRSVRIFLQQKQSKHTSSASVLHTCRKGIHGMQVFAETAVKQSKTKQKVLHQRFYAQSFFMIDG